MPRDTLTADQIVTAAIALLDEEGLDGLNMRALGNRLESAATAIYWHIKTKDELVRLAGDAIWGEIELPDLEGADWREAATAMATGLHEMLTRHPWFGQALGSYLMYGPGKSRYDDRSLELYEQAGFSPADADRAAATVFIYVAGSALGSAAHVSLTRRLSRSGRDADKALQDTVEQAKAVAMDFPNLRKRLDTTAAEQYAAAPDSTFTFGLQTILTGLESRLTESPISGVAP
ncbi:MULTISPECIES: TetR/AcrR family transcriptional regulator C-terminal domain-containing protein [unclassified Kribbella]|uniref:TetR/AcrR family transcriptional regulator C-terminal domain-containing protein n=1 Tax=unclassified Kribbella TaxID=2644121 RepID=UPI003019DD79